MGGLFGPGGAPAQYRPELDDALPELDDVEPGSA
jgi:hypothetical protein